MPRAKAVSKPRDRMTAFAFFVEVCYQEHRKQFPDEHLVFAELVRKCAEHWKVMLENEKARFQGMAIRDKKRYDLEMEEYVRDLQRMEPAKDVSKPRDPMTALGFFVYVCHQEHKKQYPAEHVGYTELTRKCAEHWKTMSEKEKTRFREVAIRDKKRYDLEMEDYVSAKAGQGRGTKRKYTKDPNAPKRSLTAFFWFSGDQRSSVKAMNPEYGVGDIAKEIGRLWHEAEPEKKRKYETMAERDKERYQREMTAYKAREESASAHNDNDDDEEEDE